uniref:Uncharacterized protein n=1 Tax=Arundo donax TaxID=35708 RepID=A0A0A9DZH9_ARUDO
MVATSGLSNATIQMHHQEKQMLLVRNYRYSIVPAWINSKKL